MKIRVLVAKPGLDGHDRGAKVIARALRDAGMEVIYTGLRQTPEMIVTAALQEDVQVIGLSILSGAHNAIVPRVMDLLRQNKMDDVIVLVGGIIPDQDIDGLKKAGVAAIFQPGTAMDDIVQFIRTHVKDPGRDRGRVNVWHRSVPRQKDSLFHSWSCSLVLADLSCIPLAQRPAISSGRITEPEGPVAHLVTLGLEQEPDKVRLALNTYCRPFLLPPHFLGIWCPEGRNIRIACFDPDQLKASMLRKSPDGSNNPPTVSMRQLAPICRFRNTARARTGHAQNRGARQNCRSGRTDRADQLQGDVQRRSGVRAVRLYLQAV